MEKEDKFIENRSVNEDFLAFLDVYIGMITVAKLVQDFIRMSGYDIGAIDKPSTQGVTVSDKLVTVTEGIRNTYEDLREKWPAEWKSWGTVKTSFQALLNLMTEINKCKEVFELAGAENGIDYDGDAILLAVMEQVILRGHGIIVPPSIQLYRFLNWVKLGNENVTDGKEPLTDSSGQVIRYPYRGIAFNKDGIDEFFRSPVDALKKQYFNSETAPGTLSRELVQDDLFLLRLRDVLLSFGLKSYYGFKVTDAITLDDTTDTKIRELSRTLTTWFSIGDNGIFAVSMLRKDDQTVIVTPYLEYDGTNKFEIQIGKWHFTFDFGAGINSFTIGPDGIDIPDNFSGNLKINIVASRKETPDLKDGKPLPAYLIGTTTGTRLEFGKMEFKFDLDLSAERKKADTYLSIAESGFYLIPGDGDSFLKKILPEKGLAILFDLKLGYSIERGIYLDGSGGGEINIPVNKKFGKLSIPSLQIGIRKLSGSSGWMAYSSLSARSELGPISIEADKMGMRLLLNAPQKGTPANLGIADADFDFKPPDGVGIQVNGKIVTGGGYLYFDKAKGEYFGVAQLCIKDKIQVKAIGIIQTRLPDGSPGYSFLLLISAEFPAIQLGMGFSLTGVGGLIGIQRSIQLQKLKDGIYSSSIDDILFPKDPLKNAYSLVSKLNSFFPAANDQYTFGIMAKLFWGSKNIISLELGLIIEFPEPVRMAIIGVLRAEVKKKLNGKDYTVLNLQVNFIAAIDFDKKFISFDASLFESKLLYMKLEGDIALRVRYGDNPDFAVTVGGFHPRFQPPALDLPVKMKRLQIILRSGNPEITVYCYLAVTSNTIQFGVGGLFVFKKWGVGIRGELFFDALFQLSPFRFETDVHLLLAASWKGYDFASIEVNGSFSGPSPWRLAGSLKLKVWIFSKTVSLDETWGDDDETQLEGVNILPLLADDLRNNGNWERLAGRTRIAVTLKKENKKEEGKALMLHPNELLAVRQNTVPLGPQIDRFGGRKPKDANRFGIVIKNKRNEVIAGTKVKNHFASGQFINLTEEQQLTVPPYELFDSGLSINGLDDILFDDFTSQPFEYEKGFIDDPLMIPAERTPFIEIVMLFEHSLRNNTLENSELGRNKKTMRNTTMPVDNYVVVDQSNQKPVNTTTFNSKAEALQNLNNMKREQLYRRASLSVISAAEMITG